MTSLAQQGLTQVRLAPTVVTNVVRPIASKPVDGAIALGALPQDKKPTLLIGGGGAQRLPIPAGGGYLSPSSSSSPAPVCVTPMGSSNLVTNLVLGGSFPAAHPVQVLTPPAQPQLTQTPHPFLQPQLHPSGSKPLTQVQYILPTESPSSPQLTHQQIVSLPPNAALANGVQSGAGVRVSPGTRGESENRGGEEGEVRVFLTLTSFTVSLALLTCYAVTDDSSVTN